MLDACNWSSVGRASAPARMGQRRKRHCLPEFPNGKDPVSRIEYPVSSVNGNQTPGDEIPVIRNQEPVNRGLAIIRNVSIINPKIKLEEIAVDYTAFQK